MRNNASRCPRRLRRQPAPVTVTVGVIAVGVVLAWGVGLAQNRGADPAERLWLDAQRFEQEGELEAALEQYALIVEQFPQSVQAPRALLGLGLGRWSQGDAPRALNATGQLRQSYAESREAAAGLVLEGDIERLQAVDQAALREARATYGRVVAIYPPARYPALAARVHALVRSGEISLLLDDVDEAAAAFLAVVEDEPPAAESGSAQLGLAHVLLEQGDWASAAETLQASLSSDADTMTGTETERRMARNRLSLIHRMVLRPQTEQSPWSATRMLTVQGIELNDPIGVDAAADGRLVIADEDGPMAAVIDRTAGPASGGGSTTSADPGSTPPAPRISSGAGTRRRRTGARSISSRCHRTTRRSRSRTSQRGCGDCSVSGTCSTPTRVACCVSMPPERMTRP